MAKLVFAAAAVRRVVEHSINAPRQSEVADWSIATKENGWTPKRSVPSEPHVLFVHDQGVYLMSNGSPRDIVGPDDSDRVDEKKDEGRSFCAYAEGCDPDKDADWHDAARTLVGGDDFGEHLPWALEIKKMLDAGATHIIVNCGKNRLSLSARYPKGKAPKAETAPESPERLAKRLKTMMRKQTVGLDTERNVLVVYKSPATEVFRKFVAEKNPKVKILNGLDDAEIARAVEIHQNRKAA